MRIGEASQASGVPERMIRHYEKLGLIPAPVRRAGGYRVYSDEDVRRLRFIAHARSVGFPVGNIAELMEIWNAGGAEGVLAAWKDGVAGRFISLRQVEDELERIAARDVL